MTNNNDYFKDETTSGNERASIGSDSTTTREFNNVDFNKTYSTNEFNNSNNSTTTTTTTTSSTNYNSNQNNNYIYNHNNNSNSNNNNSAPNNDDLEFANQLKSVQKQIDNSNNNNNGTGFVLNNVDTILSNMPKNHNNINNSNNNKNNNDEQFNNTSNLNKPINFNFNSSNNNSHNNNNNTFSINDNDIENQNDNFGEDYDLPNAARTGTTSQDYNTYSGLRKNANIIKVCAFLLMAFSIMTYFTQAWWLIFSFGLLGCPLGIYSAHNLLKYQFTIFIGYLLVDMLFRIIYLFTHLSYLKGFGVFLTLLTLGLEGYFTYFCRQFQVVMPINGRVTYREFYIAMGGNGIFDC